MEKASTVSSSLLKDATLGRYYPQVGDLSPLSPFMLRSAITDRHSIFSVRMVILRQLQYDII